MKDFRRDSQLEGRQKAKWGLIIGYGLIVFILLDAFVFLTLLGGGIPGRGLLRHWIWRPTNRQWVGGGSAFYVRRTREHEEDTKHSVYIARGRPEGDVSSVYRAHGIILGADSYLLPLVLAQDFDGCFWSSLFCSSHTFDRSRCFAHSTPVSALFSRATQTASIQVSYVRPLRVFEIYERHYQAATDRNCWSCLSGYRGDYSLRHRAIAFTSPCLVGQTVDLFGRADSCGFCDSFSEFLAAGIAKSETYPHCWHLVLHHFYRTCVRCRAGIIYFAIVRIRAAQHFSYSKWVWVWAFSLVISYLS